MGIASEIKNSFREGDTVVKLIYTFVIAFVFVKIVELVFRLGDLGFCPLTMWFAMPLNPMEFIFRPWTIVTYMLLHCDIIHLIFNMLCLYWFGRLFTELLDEKLISRVFITGGVGGAILCLLSSSVLAYGSILMGSSAAVLALLTCVSVYSPDYRVNIVFIGAIRLKYYALIFILIDIISIASWSNAGGHIAHIGGAIIGIIYGLKWRNSGVPVVKNDILTRLFRPRKTIEVVHRRTMSDMDYNATKAERGRDVDRILEKIKTSGYDSLTSEEQRILFEESKK